MVAFVQNGRSFWLTYCTNVHPGESADEIQATLERFTVPLKRRLFPREPMGLGLWLSARAAGELCGSDEALARFRGLLDTEGFVPFTVNAFPHGGFHEGRVKEKVFEPDWTHPERVRYTVDAARVLARLLPEGGVGSISTVPGSHKSLGSGRVRIEAMARGLATAAVALARLLDETGREIVLCTEPEPGASFETTEELIAFFEGPLARAWGGDEEVLRRHVGVCFDLCHMAVQFEDLEASLDRLREARIRVGKMQVSSALSVASPSRRPEAIERLRAFAEDRYLHQVVARLEDGFLRAGDLAEVVGRPAVDPRWLAAQEWRSHFHVPVFAEELGPLTTTRGEMLRALRKAVEDGLTSHLEIETYTWGVLPERERAAIGEDLIRCLEREMSFVMEELGVG